MSNVSSSSLISMSTISSISRESKLTCSCEEKSSWSQNVKKLIWWKITWCKSDIIWFGECSLNQNIWKELSSTICFPFGPRLNNRVVLITQSSWFKLLPVVFVFLLIYYLRKHLSFWKSEWFRGVSNFLHFESFLMGISMGPILILNIMAENDSNMIDLILTHLTHPWGPPLVGPWQPLVTLGDPWWHAWKWSFWPFSGIGDLLHAIV